jgi:integrase
MFLIMSYSKDNKGNLYKRDGGNWAIRFAPEDFKNESGAASEMDYDVPLPQEMSSHIEEYLKDVRPSFDPKDDRVFWPRAFKGTRGATYQSSDWLNKVMISRSRQFLAGCPGFGMHAVRHIVATDYIKNNPGSFMVAAHILHDKLETVMEAYAHLKAADGHRVYGDYVKAVSKTWKGAL